MPAYSQSTIRMRWPSSMKFAFRRSLWHGRSSIGAWRSASSIRRAIAWASSYSGGIATPVRDEEAGDRRAVVDPADRIGGAPERLRPVDGHVVDAHPDDELRDEVALRPDERGDLRPDPDTGRRDRRSVLDLAADPEQVGVVAGEPQDVAVRHARRGDQVVAVRDPA
jgi:hypothetical protein